VLDVDDCADGRLARFEVRLSALDGRLLDEADHVRRGQDADRVAAQVRGRRSI